LKPKQHCPLIIDVFGSELLEMMHKDIIQRLTKKETEFNDELLMMIIRIVKVYYLLLHLFGVKKKIMCSFLLQRLQREEITRDNAVSELQILADGYSYGECAILRAIRNM
jgi:hypothetical protein